MNSALWDMNEDHPLGLFFLNPLCLQTLVILPCCHKHCPFTRTHPARPHNTCHSSAFLFIQLQAFCNISFSFIFLKLLFYNRKLTTVEITPLSSLPRFPSCHIWSVILSSVSFSLSMYGCVLCVFVCVIHIYNIYNFLVIWE